MLNIWRKKKSKQRKKERKNWHPGAIFELPKDCIFPASIQTEGPQLLTITTHLSLSKTLPLQKIKTTTKNSLTKLSLFSSLSLSLSFKCLFFSRVSLSNSLYKSLYQPAFSATQLAALSAVLLSVIADYPFPFLSFPSTPNTSDPDFSDPSSTSTNSPFSLYRTTSFRFTFCFHDQQTTKLNVFVEFNSVSTFKLSLSLSLSLSAGGGIGIWFWFWFWFSRERNKEWIWFSFSFVLCVWCKE